MISIPKKPNVLVAPLVATLWVLLISCPTASAFYDPSLQRWINRDPLGEPGFELLRQKRLSLGPDSNAYRFVANDPVGHQDELGLQIAASNAGTAQQACQVLTATAATVSAALAAVPVGAIVTSAAMVGSVAVVTYAICNPTPWPRTWCPSRVNAVPIRVSPPEPEQCPKEVDEILPNGTRHCEFWCRKSGVKVNKFGADCDQSSIKYPAAQPGTQPLPPYPPGPPEHP